MKPVYNTSLGKAYCGDSFALMHDMASESVDLVITSPPYALHFKKEYGNVNQEDYINWFSPFAQEIHRILKYDSAPPGPFQDEDDEKVGIGVLTQICPR